MPAATPVTVRLEASEATATVATVSSSDDAVIVSVSESASLNTPASETVSVVPTIRPLWPASAAATVGPRLAGGGEQATSAGSGVGDYWPADGGSACSPSTTGETICR